MNAVDFCKDELGTLTPEEEEYAADNDGKMPYLKIMLNISWARRNAGHEEDAAESHEDDRDKEAPAYREPVDNLKQQISSRKEYD